MRRPPKKIPTTKPCSKCGERIEFEDSFHRTCDPCKAINNAAARLRSQQLKKVNAKRYQRPYVSVKPMVAPKRPKPVFDPVMESSMLRGELESFFKYLEIRPSGPVVHYEPGTRAFADVARLYEGRR